MVLNTLSPKWVSIWAETCCCSVTRVSNITRNNPISCRFGLRLRCTRLIVLTRSDKPSNAKYSHCIGMITPCAEAKPLSVSKDKVGGQSIKMKRSEERRVGKECVRTCRYGGA